MPLPSILGGGCAGVRVCVRVCRAGGRPGRYMHRTVQPMVRRDGDGAPVYAILK